MHCYCIERSLTEFYLAFLAFAASEFEDYLIPFQSDEPKIHLLYPGMCKLVSTVMQKFMKKRLFTASNITEHHTLAETDKANQKPLNHIDVGTKCTLLLVDPLISQHNAKLRKEILDFYLTVTNYLKDKFPLNKPKRLGYSA